MNLLRLLALVALAAQVQTNPNWRYLPQPRRYET
jgi:hypothetical protein